MAFACPVCSATQADGEHLANHLAFTALLHGGDHEAWLDAHVPDWSDRDPAGLASAVTPLSAETDHEVVSDGSSDANPPDGPDFPVTSAPTPLDPETRRIVEEAIEMTRQMQGSADTEE